MKAENKTKTASKQKPVSKFEQTIIGVPKGASMSERKRLVNLAVKGEFLMPNNYKNVAQAKREIEKMRSKVKESEEFLAAWDAVNK